MKTSSARQLDLEPLNSGPSATGGAERGTANSSTVVVFPSFDTTGGAYAAGSRVAGRINAAAISDDEYEDWLTERQDLLSKKIAGNITKKESNRLLYVRWSLDRVDDARYGRDLDELEDAVTRFEHLQAHIQDLQDRLNLAVNGGRRR